MSALNCLICGTEFQRTARNQKYCTAVCGKTAQKQKTHQWRQEHPERFAATRSAYYHRLTPGQKELKRQQKLESAARHREETHARVKEQSIAARARVIAGYGGRCACCGESTPEFLCIDHVNGGGREHRKQVGAGLAYYYWFEKQGFPPEFQVLCHNCNMAKGFYGSCPHTHPKGDPPS